MSRRTYRIQDWLFFFLIDLHSHTLEVQVGATPATQWSALLCPLQRHPDSHLGYQQLPLAAGGGGMGGRLSLTYHKEWNWKAGVQWIWKFVSDFALDIFPAPTPGQLTSVLGSHIWPGPEEGGHFRPQPTALPSVEGRCLS